MKRPAKNALSRLRAVLATTTVVAGVFFMSGWTACQITIEPLDEEEQSEPGDPNDPGDPTEPGDPNDPTEPGEPGDPTEPGEPGDPTVPPRPDDCEPVETCDVYQGDDGNLYEHCYTELLCPEPIDPPDPNECELIEFCQGFVDSNGQATEECWVEERCPEPIDPNECDVIQYCETIGVDPATGDTDPNNGAAGEVVCWEELLCPEPGDDCFDLSLEECANVEHCTIEELPSPCPLVDDNAPDGNTDPSLPPSDCQDFLEPVCVPVFQPEPLPPQCQEVELCIVVDDNGEPHLVDATNADDANAAGLNVTECWVEVICEDGTVPGEGGGQAPGEPTDPDQPNDNGEPNQP